MDNSRESKDSQGETGIWETGNWESECMTIFVTWQLRATLESIRNSCDVLKCTWLCEFICLFFYVFLLLHFNHHQKSGWSMVSWKGGWSSWQKGMSRLLGSFHLSSFYQDITLYLRRCSVSICTTTRMYFYISLFLFQFIFVSVFFLGDNQDLLWYG